MAKFSPRDQQRINMVAQIISENGVSPEEARKLNATEGWTYDIRWKHESYLSDNYTRVEGDILSDTDLEAAIKLAEERGIRYLLLTVRDVAATLRVAEPTVREWIKSGELPAIELGGRTGYRITEPDLEAFMQSRKKYLDRHQLPEKESAMRFGLNGNHHGAFAAPPDGIEYLGDGAWNLPDGATVEPMGDEDWLIAMADGTKYRCWTED